MWNILRSRSLLFCDWIVFTHQQAGVSKKKVSGTTSSIRTFFPGQQLYFVDFFFLFRYFSFFFICPEDACKNSNNNSKEGTQNGRWWWWITRNGNSGLNFVTTRMIHFCFHERITIEDFFVFLRFSWGEFFMRVLIEKRTIKSLE